MKKVLLFLVLFVFMFLCIKSALNLGEKETIIDVINTKTDNSSEEEIDSTSELIQDSYYTSIKPIEVQYTYITEKVSSQNMFILKEESSINNETIMNLINEHNFEKDTLILVSSNYEIKSYRENELKKDNIDISLIKGKEKESTIIIKLKNVKITSLNNINIHFDN